jgi:hypothetical protein
MRVSEIVSGIADKLLQFVLGRIGFWSERLYSVNLDRRRAQFEVREGNSRKWLIIVARSFYFEVVRDYPVGSVRDLHKIIKSEPWRYPFRGRLFYRIESRSDQSSRVTSWVVKQSVIDSFENEPVWIIPESVCFEAVLEGDRGTFNRLGENVFVGKTPDGLFSGAGDTQKLLSSIGMAPDFSDKNYSEEIEGPELIDKLLLGAEQTVRSAPSVFFNKSIVPSMSGVSWRKNLRVSLILVSFYLSALSVYAFTQTALINHELDGLQRQADSIMDLKRGIDERRSFLDELDNTIPNGNPHLHAWSVYLDLKELGVQFDTVTTSTSSMTVVCVADKATTVLGLLVSDSRVKSAQFISAIRQEKQKESFSIQIEFRDMNFSSKNSKDSQSNSKMSQIFLFNNISHSMV